MSAAKVARTRRERPPVTREAVVRLEDLPNVGPSIAGDLRGIGVPHPSDLVGRDPYALFDTLCAATGIRHDPCVLDVFISAVRFMEGAPGHKWWYYTDERKRTLRSARAVGHLNAVRPWRLDLQLLPLNDASVPSTMVCQGRAASPSRTCSTADTRRRLTGTRAPF